MDDTLIRLRGISKEFAGVRALDELSLEVGPGITGLLGPNGAGKTTLIKLLLGLLRPTSGEGEVLGLSLRRQSREIRSRVGYMPEDDCWIDGFTGVEMVAFAARVSGLPGVEATRRAHEILDFCSVEQERYREVKTYSSGMRQQLKFAQAIVHDPRLLILDEPTASLDPDERRGMLQRVRTLARRSGKAVLLSTHILPDVQQISDDVVILVSGRVRLVEGMEALARPASPGYRVELLGGEEVFEERLRARGLRVSRGEDGALEVLDAGEAFERDVWRWAREAGVSLRRLRPARNSLEDIFLRAVREERDADP